MSSNFHSKSESIEESCLDIPYIEIMLPSEQMPMYLDSQTLEICHGETSKDPAKPKSKSDMVNEATLTVNEFLHTKINSFTDKPEGKLPSQNLGQAAHSGPGTENELTKKETNVLNSSVKSGNSNQPGNVAGVIPPKKGAAGINNVLPPEKSGPEKIFTCIRASDIEKYLPNSESVRQIVGSVGEETSSVDSNPDNFDTFLTSEEKANTKLERSPSELYLGPFTRRLKMQPMDLKNNEVSPVPNVDSVSNGLIIEIYHYWMKQKYKISRLCQWIRGLCPQPLNLTDSSLYVKIKNLIKMKHKQIIRSKTQKFAGCLKTFQCSPFFKSENISYEDLSNETERERFLRMELKKAQKIIHRQEKDIGRKKMIIKSISYDLGRLTEELNALKEANKSVKKKHRFLEQRGVVEDYVGNEDKQDGGSDITKKRGREKEVSKNTKKIKPSPDESEESKPLEIKNYFSLSGNQNGTHLDSDCPPCDEEGTDKRRRRRRRRGLKTRESETEINIQKNLEGEEIPSRWLGFDKRVKIKIEQATFPET